MHAKAKICNVVKLATTSAMPLCLFVLKILVPGANLGAVVYTRVEFSLRFNVCVCLCVRVCVCVFCFLLIQNINENLARRGFFRIP